MKLGVTKFAGIEADADSANAAADNDDVTLAECFRDMREDWRQLRIQRIENAEERKAERKAARNGVTFRQSRFLLLHLPVEPASMLHWSVVNSLVETEFESDSG